MKIRTMNINNLKDTRAPSREEATLKLRVDPKIIKQKIVFQT